MSTPKATPTEAHRELARLRAEVERLNALGGWAHTCIHHTDDERKAWVACPCCAIARAIRAEAELAAERDQLAAARQSETVAIASWDEERGRALREGARVVEWKARAERAEAKVEAITDTSVKLLASLTDERNQLRAEVDLDEELQAATEKSLKITTIRVEKAEKLWKEFITLMEIAEESDSGNAFNPNKISSCRAMDGKRLNEILIEARQIVFKQ